MACLPACWTRPHRQRGSQIQCAWVYWSREVKLAQMIKDLITIATTFPRRHSTLPLQPPPPPPSPPFCLSVCPLSVCPPPPPHPLLSQEANGCPPLIPSCPSQVPPRSSHPAKSSLLRAVRMINSAGIRHRRVYGWSCLLPDACEDFASRRRNHPQEVFFLSFFLSFFLMSVCVSGGWLRCLPLWKCGSRFWYSASLATHAPLDPDSFSAKLSAQTVVVAFVGSETLHHSDCQVAAGWLSLSTGSEAEMLLVLTPLSYFGR